MNFKLICVLLALLGSAEAATNKSNKTNKTNSTNTTKKAKEKAKPKWIETPWVFKNNMLSKFGVEQLKMDDDLINSNKISKNEGEYGVIRRIKWCTNYWSTKIEYDL